MYEKHRISDIVTSLPGGHLGTSLAAAVDATSTRIHDIFSTIVVPTGGGGGGGDEISSGDDNYTTNNHNNNNNNHVEQQ